MNILKIVFLFLGVWMTLVNSGRLSNKNRIPAKNFIYQAIGIVGFIVLQFNLL